MGVIAAAGTLPWRCRRGALEVALVHRPKYDDWSWPKGKVDPGEDWPVTAARETREETGLDVRLGRPLPPTAYTVLDRDGLPATKEVRYWSAEAVGGAGELENEIDELAWLDVVTAHDRLDYARDREQLRALVRYDAAGELTTWPLVLVRHAKATPRSDWTGDDARRPLDDRGTAQAGRLVPLLSAFGISRLVSSPSARCADTLRPYAVAAGLPLRLREGLSEEGHEADPARAARHLRRALARGAAMALCSHGPVLPSLIGCLLDRVEPPAADAPGGSAPVASPGTDRSALRHLLVGARDQPIGKGEVLVCHLVGTGGTARIVSVERHTS